MSRKTTIYLPDALKDAVERAARQRRTSEAKVIREAVAAAVTPPRPASGFLNAEPFADRADAALSGFGER